MYSSHDPSTVATTHLLPGPIHSLKCRLPVGVKGAAASMQDKDATFLSSLTHTHVHTVVRTEIVLATVHIEFVWC